MNGKHCFGDTSTLSWLTTNDFSGLEAFYAGESTFYTEAHIRACQTSCASKNKRGRGTKKTPVSVVERGGKVIARVATDLTSKGILQFIR